MFDFDWVTVDTASSMRAPRCKSYRKVFLVCALIIATSALSTNASTSSITSKNSRNQSHKDSLKNLFPTWDAPYLSPKTELNSLTESIRAYGAIADIMRINIARMKFQLHEKLSEDPSDSIACIMLGDILIEEGALESAIVFFDSAVALAPFYPAAHLALGRAYYKLKEFQGAIVQFDLSIKLDSLNASAWSLRAIAHSMNDNWSAAKEDFEQANVIRILSRAERYRYALCLWATGYLDSAIIEFENSIQGSASDYRIYVSWGMAEASRGNIQQARIGLAHAIELRKPDESLFEALADINALDERADSTAYYLEKAVELAPFQTRLRNRLALVYASQKKHELSDQMFEISTSLESENAATYASWAQAKALAGDFNAAAKLIDRALRLAPLDETIIRLRSEILPGLPLIEN